MLRAAGCAGVDTILWEGFAMGVVRWGTMEIAAGCVCPATEAVSPAVDP